MGQAQAEQRRRKAEAYRKERPAGLDKEDKRIKAMGKEVDRGIPKIHNE
jgi:uncharacterized membrane protein YqiK